MPTCRPTRWWGKLCQVDSSRRLVGAICRPTNLPVWTAHNAAVIWKGRREADYRMQMSLNSESGLTAFKFKSFFYDRGRGANEWQHLLTAELYADVTLLCTWKPASAADMPLLPLALLDHQCTLHTAVNAQILESNAELEGHSMAHTSAQAQTVALNKRRIKLTLSCGVWLGPHIRYSRSSHIDSCHHYCSAVYAFTTACRINA